jgi:hypothetical protein
VDPGGADAAIAWIGIYRKYVSLHHMGAGELKKSRGQTDLTNVTRWGGHGGPVDASGAGAASP